MAERIGVVQFTLPDLGDLVPVTQKGLNIAERFEVFHKANPHVYQGLRTIALALNRAGFKRYSMKAIYERLRFAVIETHGEPWKLNNDFTALYARKLMEDEPELVGFFELRERTAAAREEGVSVHISA